MYNNQMPYYNRDVYNDVVKINEEIKKLNEDPNENGEQLQKLYMKQIMRGLDLVGYGLKNNGYMPY